MRETVVSKDELLKRLRDNRDHHVAALDEGERLWRVALIARLNEMMQAACDGEDVPYFHGVERPASHVADYDAAISLLEFDQRGMITLDEREARRYVLDQWDWRAGFYGTLRGLGYRGEQAEYPGMVA